MIDLCKPEVLSPCGSYEALVAALRTGADAVYVGSQKFSARHNAKNFTPEELKDAVKLCHKHGALIYQAINTCILETELNDLADEIKYACEIGVDGIIMQDQAVLYIVKSACPDMPAHASTQMTLHTERGVEWAKERGYSRVVLSRELPAEKISRLAKMGIETEVFVHGALCMSVSGQCYLSALIGTRSANRGLCAGACRLPFSTTGRPKDKYALSLKDLSLAQYADELTEAGVSSLKIEGRMKRPEYVAAATNALRRAVDGLDYDTRALKAVFSRSGFTDGYYRAQRGYNMFGARSREDVVSAETVLPELSELFRKEKAKFPLSLYLEVKAGKPCLLKASSGEDCTEILGDIPEAALNRPLDAETACMQLSKLGGTLYYADSIDAQIDPGLMLPLSKINALRRQALNELDELRTKRLTKTKHFDSEKIILARPKTLNLKYPDLYVSVKSLSQLDKMDVNALSRVIIPLSKAGEYIKRDYPAEKAILTLPRFTFDEDAVALSAQKAVDLGFDTFECTNPAHILLCRQLNAHAFGGFGLNVTNSIAAYELAREGLSEITLSFELKAYQAGSIASPVPTGALLYGKLPLMVCANCPIEAEVGYKKCSGSLTDRTGARFSVVCPKKSGLDYCEVLNSKVMVLSDKLRDFNLDFGILYFTDESAEEAALVLKRYLDGEKPSGEFTRGLYYRGIE